MTATYAMGLDLGPPGEPTGFAVLERSDDDEPVYRVRHLERFPAGSTYTSIVETIAARAATPPLKGAPLVVDRTAVGLAVINQFRRVAPSPWLVQVVIGAGHAVQPV